MSAAVLYCKLQVIKSLQPSEDSRISRGPESSAILHSSPLSSPSLNNVQMTPGCCKITQYTSTRIRLVGYRSELYPSTLYARDVGYWTSLILGIMISFPAFMACAVFFFLSFILKIHYGANSARRGETVCLSSLGNYDSHGWVTWVNGAGLRSYSYSLCCFTTPSQILQLTQLVGFCEVQGNR